jgi:hypothetical protein
MTTLDAHTTPAAAPAAEAYGPHPPTAEERLQARNAPDLAIEAGCDVDEAERLTLAYLQTDAAFREADDRAVLQAAAEHPEPELEAEP